MLTFPQFYFLKLSVYLLNDLICVLEIACHFCVSLCSHEVFTSYMSWVTSLVCRGWMTCFGENLKQKAYTIDFQIVFLKKEKVKVLHSQH